MRGEIKGRGARGATKRLARRRWGFLACAPMRFIVLLLTVSLVACTSIPPLPKNTPLTKAGYSKVLEDRLGSIWYQLMRANARDVRLRFGTVEVTFEIPEAGGHPRNYRVTSNTAGALNEEIARQAVARLMAPPPPPAVLQASKSKDVFIMEESFTTFGDGELTPAPTKR